MTAHLVLDTNAFLARGFRYWLSEHHHGPVVLPAVAYAELGMHLRRRLSSVAYDRALAEAGIEVEWLTPDLARVAVETGLAQGDWERRGMDYLIAAHAFAAPRLLVTNNLRDFPFLGDRVVTPSQLMAASR